MKRFLVIITAFYFLLPETNGQLWKVRRLELTGGIGTTRFFGDNGGFSNDRRLLRISDLAFRQTRLNLNENIRFRINQNLSVRGNLTWGILHSNDAGGTIISQGFEEDTYFFEYAIIGEYHFINNKDEIPFVILRENKSYIRSLYQSLDLYLFAGLGGLAYSVNSNRGPNNGNTQVIPAGLGLNMIYSDKINFGLEFGARYAFSDRVDGDAYESSRKDAYHFLNFTITYKIRTASCFVVR